MKVLDLRCEAGHVFEGWFGSEQDYQDQLARKILSCPMCGTPHVSKTLSAPRLNLASGASQPPEATAPAVAPASSSDVAAPTAAQMQAAFLHAVRHMMRNTEDVGPRFAQEARRIHHGEAAERGIRGQATPEEREALQEEGIAVLSLPVPAGLKGELH